jgi:hypothetical protein
MHKKVMEKAITKIIRETRHKEREENKVRKFATCFTVDEHALNMQLLEVEEQILNTIGLQQLLRKQGSIYMNI